MPAFSYLPQLDGNVLYLDVGGSAIKSIAIPCHKASDFYSYLKGNSEAAVIRTEWDPHEKGETLTQIVSRLVSKLERVHRVAISIGGSNVSSNGRKYGDWMTKNGRVEGNLAESLEHVLALNRGSVSILTDSLAWGQGVRSLLRESGRSLADGVGLLVVGTGVAFTTLTDTGVALRHLHDWNRYDWDELAQFAKFKHGDWIHKHLGAGYFKWRDSQYQSDIDRREETTKRYQFVLEVVSIV
jgi:hypothetical protein